MKNDAETVDTIFAVATPAGRGGVSIIRLSGPQAFLLGSKLSKKNPQINQLQYCSFVDRDNELLDQGLILFFKAPASFTGEDVVECHIHGSPVVADLISQELASLSARPARPGEFSERAFLNDKMDLSQAEAVSDLINSVSSVAARHAIRSLRGDFAEKINDLVSALTELRVYVEAAIDFPEEEVDFLNDTKVTSRLENIEAALHELLQSAKHGVVLNEGINVVIAGEPNAGKSSLLNLLAGYERAIVTDIPGTTRDLLDMVVTIKGVPIRLSDTAGLRTSDDPVEREGIKRARAAMADADVILLLIDSATCGSPQTHPAWLELSAQPELLERTIIVMNKIDLTGSAPLTDKLQGRPLLHISIRDRVGIELLESALLNQVDFHPGEEGGFMARRRHVTALQLAQISLEAARTQLEIYQAGELMAEDLRAAQQHLGEITGKVSSDDLLGEIFSSFCIGK